MQVAQQRKQAETKQLEIEKTLQDNDRKIQERKAQLLEKRHAAEEREAKLRQDKDKEAMLRRRREQQRQQEIEMHIQAQKEEEDKRNNKHSIYCSSKNKWSSPVSKRKTKYSNKNENKPP